MGKRDQVEEIIEEARESYGLRERLMGITRRERNVTVYTDEEVADALGGAVDELIPGTEYKSGGRRRWGVRGELDELAERAKELASKVEDGVLAEEEVADEADHIESRINDLRKEAKGLLETLQKTSFTLTLRAVPELVIKDARRQAKLALQIKGKVPESRVDDFNEELYNTLVALSTTKWVDHEMKAEHGSISIEDVRAFRDLLPFGEFPKLTRAVDELSAEAHIANAAVDDADF